MVRDIPRLDLVVNSVSTEGFTVHMNSDMIFGVNFYVFK